MADSRPHLIRQRRRARLDTVALKRLAATGLCLVLLAGCRATSPGASTVDAPVSEMNPVVRTPQARAQSAPVFPATNRPDVRGTRGAVVSDHPLASAAGLAVLQEGGNAVDASIATAAVLAVVRPHMNGVGGDAFALIHEATTGQVHALNGSGRAGEVATPAFFERWGEIPQAGAGSVTVPGAVAAWIDAHERFGSLPLSRLLAPAIHYAREGFPVSTRLAADFEEQGGSLNPAGQALYLPGGSAPAVGSLLRNPALARTLEAIATGGKAAFYDGPIGEQLAAYLTREGGYLQPSDFRAHQSDWVEALSVDYLDHTFLVMPPNTQGITQLQQMEMAKSFPFSDLGHNTSSYFHNLIEIKKLAFSDRDRWVADPEMADIPVEALMDRAYLSERARRVRPEMAAAEVPPGIGETHAGDDDRYGLDDGGDTVYLTVIDADGNAVSWIQSLFAGFGSGLLEPETGVMLQNRGALFTLEDGHPNKVAPGKRPFHTLTPMMALRNGQVAFTIGTPGGDSQTQSLLQIVHNMLLFGMTPQEAVEAPRFRSYNGLRVSVEDRVPGPVRAELSSWGHQIRVISGWTATFGGAQMIYVDPLSGTLTTAADPRREAYAVAW